MAEHIVIVGAGHAGGSVANYLRQYGYQGPVTIIGREYSGPRI
jgi:3-phenylpropionate/trans-cinnamate dioxygenase ferredoxin reductase subunit